MLGNFSIEGFECLLCLQIRFLSLDNKSDKVKLYIAQSTGAVEYTDCTSAEG